MEYVEYRNHQRELSHMIAVYLDKNNINKEWASKMLVETIQEYQIKHK